MATVVVVEDDEGLRPVTTRILRRAGHTVIEAADGAAGLQAVRDHTPDIVVTDIDMPIMSGVELSRAIRRDPGTKDLPVLLVSGSLVSGDKRPGEAQATAILRKPFRSAELLDCAEKLLGTGHRNSGAPQPCS